MKRLSFRIVLFVFVTVFIFSCEETEDLDLAGSQTTEEILDSEREIYYGPIVRVGSQYNPETTPNTENQTVVTNSWQRINRDMLSDLSRNAEISYLNRDDLQNRFTWIMGQFGFGPRRPISVSINDMKFGPGTNPNGGQNWYVDLRAKGQQSGSTTTSPTTPWKRVDNTNKIFFTNTTNSTLIAKGPQWSIETGNTKNWNVSGTISTEVGGSVGIPLVTEGSVKVSVGLTIGGGGSKTEKITEVVPGPDLPLQPGQTAVWELQESHVDVSSEWHVPIEFRGRVGSDYGTKKYHGSHFWGTDAYYFFYEYTQRDRKYIVKLSEESSKSLRVTGDIQ